MKQTFVDSGQKLLAPGLEKGLSEGAREALEIPMVVAEFRHEHRAAKLLEDSPLGEEGFDFGVFANHEIDFTRVVDRRIDVVDTIVHEMRGQKDDVLGEGPDFEIETGVLIGGPRSGEKVDFVLGEKITTIDSGPDGGSKTKERTAIKIGGEDGQGGDFGSGLGALGAVRLGAEFIVIGLDDVGVMFPGGVEEFLHPI